MKPHLKTALAAIQALRYAATRGDPEAVAGLVEIGNTAAGHLAALVSHPEGSPGRIAAREVAKCSLRWPVSLDAIAVCHKQDLARFAALEVGSMAGIRLHENPRGGKPRDFRYESQTGFALDIRDTLEVERINSNRRRHPADIHLEIAAPGVQQLKRDWKQLAALLEPLSRDSLKTWQAAGMELCRDWCGGQWQSFPWPACVTGKAGRVTDENGHIRTVKSAVAGKILAGLKSLLP